MSGRAVWRSTDLPWWLALSPALSPRQVGTRVQLWISLLQDQGLCPLCFCVLCRARSARTWQILGAQNSFNHIFSHAIARSQVLEHCSGAKGLNLLPDLTPCVASLVTPPVHSQVSPRSRGAEMRRIRSSGGGQGLTRCAVAPGQRGRSPMGLVEGAELQ